MTKQILLTQGKVALVDDADYERVIRFSKWCAQINKQGKFHASCHAPDNHEHTILMHRFILNAPKGIEVDHINGDRLDNRRSNLRLATDAENARNRGRCCLNTSGYKGVGFDKKLRKWGAHIRLNDRLTHLGFFNSAIEAARAYDKAARKHWGEFARLNLPD